MKKNTMTAILSLIANIDTEEAETVRQEITAELKKGEDKAQANRDLYASVHDIIMGSLSTETPVTISELYESIEGDLPDSFSRSKVQYAVTRLWTDEVVKVEGKVNSYKKKG